MPSLKLSIFQTTLVYHKIMQISSKNQWLLNLWN